MKRIVDMLWSEQGTKGIKIAREFNNMRNIYKEIRNFPFIYLLFIQINIENTNRTDLVFFSTLETVFTFILFKLFHFLYFSSVYQSFI